MNIFNKKIITVAITAIVMASSVSVVNASVAVPTISILDTSGTEASPFTVGDVSNVVYSTTSLQFADRIAYGKNGNFANQNPTTIGESVLSIFNLPGAIYLSSYADGSTANSSSQTGNGNKSGSFTSNFAYKYLAVHFGNNELLFDFSSTGGIAAGKTFNISNLPNGLSNWRAYDIVANNPSNPTPIGEVALVPVPAAVWLFGSALAGFNVVTRRKSKTA